MAAFRAYEIVHIAHGHAMRRRNVADITKCLSELARVLRPGASLAVLDFNNSDEPFVDGFQVGCCVVTLWLDIVCPLHTI